MSDDVFENALVAAQESSDSPTRFDLLQKLSELVFDGRMIYGPSAYLSALSEEGSIEDIKREIAKHTLDPATERLKSQRKIEPALGNHNDPGDEDDKVRVLAEPVVLKSYKLPLPQIDETIARSLGWVSPEDYNRRVTELLNANNALVERRRIAEQRQHDAEALIRSLRDFLSDPVRAVLLAEIERLVSGT